MTTYNFKRNANVFLVYGGLKYKLDIYSDINCSQTFSEQSVPVKTLHTQYNNFDGATITTASPGNFDFTIPLIDEDDLKIVFNLLRDYDANYNINSFDLYIQLNYDVYKLEMCVIDTGTFTIDKNNPLLLSVSGTMSKLSRVGQSGIYTIPGTLQTRSVNRTYILARRLQVAIDGAELSSVASLTLEIQNRISWLQADTLQNSLAVTSVSNMIFPSSYILEGRLFSGSIQQYVTDATYTTVQSWDTNAAITIKVGDNNNIWTLDISIPSAVFTNRLESGDAFMESYDFRMISNPTALSTVITYN